MRSRGGCPSTIPYQDSSLVQASAGTSMKSSFSTRQSLMWNESRSEDQQISVHPPGKIIRKCEINRRREEEGRWKQPSNSSALSIWPGKDEEFWSPLSTNSFHCSYQRHSTMYLRAHTHTPANIIQSSLISIWAGWRWTTGNILLA